MTGAAANSRCRVKSELVSETDLGEISLLIPTFEYHGRPFAVSSLVAAVLYCMRGMQKRESSLSTVCGNILTVYEGGYMSEFPALMLVSSVDRRTRRACRPS